MKRILAVLFVIGGLFLSGCTSEGIQTDIKSEAAVTNTTFGAFNDEVYIWESFIFTTNRVHEVK